MNFGLVKHIAIRNSKQRKEWYEITEKGKIFLEILKQLGQLIEK